MNNTKNKFKNITQSPWFWPCAVFILALALRLFFLETFWNAWFGNGFPSSDARSLDSTAMNILQGRGLANYMRFHLYYSYRVPFYPIFLSMIYRFFGHNYLAAKIVQCIASAATVTAIYTIAIRTFRQKTTAVVAGAVAAFYLPFIYYAHCLLTETLFVFFLVLAVLLLIETTQKRSFRLALMAGAVSGLAALTRAAMVCLIPFFAIWLIAVFRREIKTLLRIGVGFSMAIIVVLSPWLIRNYKVHGQPFFATTGMRHLWNGADPKYESSCYSRPAWREALWINPRATETERINLLTPKALGYISKYPALYLRFCIKRLRYLWGFPNLFRKLPLNSIGIMDALPALVIPFGLMGLVLSTRRWRQTFLFGGIVLTYSVFHSIFGGTERFRVPLDWIFIIYAAWLIMKFIRAGKTPLLDTSSGENDFFVESVPDGKSRNKWLKYTVLALTAIVVGTYLIMVLPQYLRKESTPFTGYDTDEVAVEEALKEAGLYDKWLQQERRLYTIQDIIDMRIAGGDPGAKYPDWIIAWTGEMHYIIRDSDGKIVNFNLYVNAGGRHPGDGKFDCKIKDNAMIKVSNPREGMAATVVGYTTNEIIGAPEITAVGILPYEK